MPTMEYQATYVSLVRQLERRAMLFGQFHVANEGAGMPVKLAIPAGKNFAIVQAQGGVMRWRGDGTPPSSSVGLRLFDGDEPTVFSENLSKLLFAPETAGATIIVTYK